MKLLFWRKTRKRTPTELYKGINAHCSKHPPSARCLCNKCWGCIQEETKMPPGSITYEALPDSGVLICNGCLEKYSDEELAEFYAWVSTKVWHQPVSKQVVLATLIKKPSHTASPAQRKGN